MEKESIYVVVFILIPLVIFIISIYKLVQWGIKVKSGEIVAPPRPLQYYEEHPEEFSIEHTYAIVKGPIGRDAKKKDRKIFFWRMCPWFFVIIVMMFSSWLEVVEKYVPFEVILVLQIVVMAGAAILFISGLVSEDKLWVCPYCKKQLIYIKLTPKESRKLKYDSKAIFITGKWNKKRLLLVADHCPSCRKLLVNDYDVLLNDDKEGWS